MIPFAYRLHESLMNELSHGTPGFPILQHRDVIAMSDQVCDKGMWPVAIKSTFLIQEIFDVLSTVLSVKTQHVAEYMALLYDICIHVK